MRPAPVAPRSDSEVTDRREYARQRLRDVDGQWRPLVRGRAELKAEWDAQRAPFLAILADCEARAPGGT